MCRGTVTLLLLCDHDCVVSAAAATRGRLVPAHRAGGQPELQPSRLDRDLSQGGAGKGSATRPPPPPPFSSWLEPVVFSDSDPHYFGILKNPDPQLEGGSESML